MRAGISPPLCKLLGVFYARLKSRGCLHNFSSVIISLKMMKWKKKKRPCLTGRLISAQHFIFLLKQIVDSCTEINSLWRYANLFGCFEVLVLKNRVKQLILLTFYKNLKNQRKSDDFAVQVTSMEKIRMLKIISLISNTVPLCISVSLSVFFVIQEVVEEKLGAP